MKVSELSGLMVGGNRGAPGRPGWRNKLGNREGGQGGGSCLPR